jgi:hypothetical protein
MSNAFAIMMCHRTGEYLPAWMDAVQADDLPALVASLRRDQAAIINGRPWPTAPGRSKAP